jgi:flagellar biosynthesis anti-sigma factor FlgM
MARATGANGNASAATDNSSGVDQTSFSFDQARVQSLATQALAAPEVRQEKVAPLQQAIANGDYQVDPGKVADAIAAEAGSGTIR